MILFHIVVANLKMTVRNRQAWFWSLAFPLIFVVVFGIFYSDDFGASVAVIDHASDGMSQRLIAEIDAIEGLERRNVADEAEARRQVIDGELGFALALPEGLAETALNNPPAQITMIYDDTRPLGGIAIGFVDGFVNRANLELSGAQPSLELATESVSGFVLDRLDLVMPGIAIWGAMSFSVMGLAAALTTYREKKILLRIDATPLKVSVYFASQVITFLIIALIQVAIVLAAGALIFGAALNGNPLNIAAIIILSNLVFLNIAYIVAGYARTVAAASGLGNVIVLPLLFFSGIFFPIDALPAIVRYVVEFLPLSPAVVTMRGVALEARPIWDFPVELATIAFWIVITAFVATRVFKFR